MESHNQENNIERMTYFLFAPAPFINCTVKLLHHEIVNLSLLCWVLYMQQQPQQTNISITSYNLTTNSIKNISNVEVS